MVYLNVGQLGALQYIQICATTMTDGRWPLDASLTHSAVWPSASRLSSAEVPIWLVVVWPTAPHFFLPEAALIWPDAPRLTSQSCCVTVDSNTPLYLCGHGEIYTNLPTGDRPFFKGFSWRHEHSLCRTSLSGIYQYYSILYNYIIFNRETDSYSASALPLVQNLAMTLHIAFPFR